MFKEKHNYGEFLRSEENIATNILADRLSLLEQEGIVVKRVDPNHGSKFIYKLSPKGIDLLPMLVEFIMWSAKYDIHSGVDMKFVNRIKRNREGVLKEISSRLKKR
jgi:DNA-binding HxlR family transcriptional regulator